MNATNKQGPILILGSSSPRRKELLGLLQAPYTVMPSPFEEFEKYEDLRQQVEFLAIEKGKALIDQVGKLAKGRDFLIVAGDTLVGKDGMQFGKPKTDDVARQMLNDLSNQWHDVFTGMFLYWQRSGENPKEIVFTEKTKVKCGPITEDLLVNYLKSGEALDKAGAYGIQGLALTFIERIEGCYSNVVGLPVFRLAIEMKKILGLSPDGNLADFFVDA